MPKNVIVGTPTGPVSRSASLLSTISMQNLELLDGQTLQMFAHIEI